MTVRLKRWIRRITAAAAAFLLLFLLLHTPPAKRLVSILITTTVSWLAGADLSIGKLDYRLWVGELEVESVSYLDVDGSARIELLVPQADVSIAPSFAIKAVVHQPRVLVSLQDNEIKGEKGGDLDWSFLDFIPSAEVRGGVVEVWEGDAWRIDMADVNALGDERQDRYAIELTAGSATLRFADVEFVLDDLGAEGAVVETELVLDAIRLASGASTVEAKGSSDMVNPFSGTVELGFELDASFLRGWLPEAEIEGMVSGAGNIAYGDDTFTAAGSFDSSALQWGDLEPWAVEGHISLAEGELNLDDTILRGYDGRVDVEARMNLGEEATQSLRFRYSGLRTASFIEDIAPDFPALSASLEGDASLELRDWNLEAAEWSASALAKPERNPRALPIGGTIQATGAGMSGEIEAALASEPLRTTMEARGRVGTDRLDVTVEQRFDRLEETLAWLTEQNLLSGKLPDFKGSLRASGNIRGTFDRPTWTATLGTSGLQIGERPYELTALLNGDRRAARIEDLTLLGSQGRFEARGALPLSDQSEWDLDLNLSGMPSAHLVRDLDIDLPGELSGKGQVVGPAKDPDWSLALRHHSEDLLADGAGEVELSVWKEKSVVRFTTRSSSGDASIDGSGSYSLDVESIEARLALANLSLGGLTSTVTDLEGIAGSLSGELEAHGTLESPGIRANLVVRDGSFREHEIKPIVLGFVSDGATLDLSLDLDGERLARGQGRLEDPYPLKVEVDLSRFPFTALVRGLTDLEPEVVMNGRLELDVALSRPEDLRYRASIEEYQVVLPQVTQRASDFTIEGDRHALAIRNFRSSTEGRSLSLQGVIPLESEESFDFDVAGDLDLSVLVPFLEDVELEGRAKAQIKIGGTLSAPELIGTVEVDANAGKWDVLEWEGMELRARAEGRRLFVDRAILRTLGGVVSARGEVPVRDTEPGRLSFSLQEIDLGLLFVDPESGQRPSLVVSAEGDFDLGELSVDGVQGSGRITSVVAGVGDVEIRNSESCPWHLVQSAFTIERLRLVGSTSDLTTEIGPIRFGDELAWQAMVRGKLDLSILSPFLSSVPGMQLAGNTDLDFRLEDGPDGFVGEGRGTLSGGRLVVPQPPIVVTDLGGALTLDATGVRLSDLSARVGDGRLEGEGHIDLTDRSRPVLDLKIRAEAVPLQLAEGFRGRVSGALQFAGQEDFALSGRVRLDRGIFDRELGEEDRLMSEPMVIYGSATEESFLDRVTLAIDVETVGDLHVENSLANLEAGANIALGGTLEDPVVNGIVVLRSDGRFNIGRNRLNITSGRVTFQDYPGEVPRIQLSAFTRVGSTTINLDLDGTMDDIQTRLSAPDDPNLSEGDLTSLLVTGRTLENAAEGGTQVASTWMMSSMANLLHEGWGDLFTFGPPPGAGPLSLGEEANPTSRLTLGRGITDRLSLTYSIALDQTESQLWILDYRLARDFWIQGIQENGNEYTAGFTHRFTIGQKKPETAGTGTEGRIISGVNYQADLTGKVAELSKQVKTKAGDTYDYWAASEDARRIRDTLVREGYRSALVEVGTSPDDERIALTFKIEAGLPIEIVWEGDDPGNDLKKKIEAAWNGRVPLVFLVPDLAARATWELRSKRYYTAQVKGRSEPGEESRRVIFRCVMGRQGKQVVLSFDGNENLDDLALIAALPETRTPEFFALLEKPGELAKGILLRYASEGYLDVSAELGEASFDPDAGLLKVVINVEEGPISRISDLQFDGVVAFSIEEMSRTIKVTAGQALDVEAIRSAQTDLRAFYRDSGFPDAAVKSRLTRSPEGIEVVLRVDEGPRARVGTVRIAGTSRVKDSIVQNQLTFREGDTLRVSALNKSMQNLYDSGVFRSADVRVDSESSNENVKDVLVQVAERSGFDMSYGVRYNFVPDGISQGNLEAKVEGLEGVIRASVANPWGYGLTLGVYAFVQDGRSLFSGYDRFPLFLGRRLPTDLVLELEDDQSLPGFSLQQWNVTFQQTKRIRDNKFSVQWNVRLGRGHFQGVVGEDGQPFDVNEFRTQLGTSLIYDKRDSMAHPSRGKFWNLTVQVAPEALGSETAFFRFFGQLFNFHPLFGSVVWASSYRVGLAQGTREILFIEDRFKAGGANSVRGFAQNALGPTVAVPEVEEEVYIGGQAVVVMNQELRFPIWKDLHGAVFYDLGNVFPRVRDISFSELRHTAGGGVRYTLPFGALRLDWARILDVQAGEPRSRFHFGFGYAF